MKIITVPTFQQYFPNQQVPRNDFVLSQPGERSVQSTCDANPVGENSSFIFTVCVKSVPLYNFKLAYVAIHMAVKECFEAQF